MKGLLIEDPTGHCAVHKGTDRWNTPANTDGWHDVPKPADLQRLRRQPVQGVYGELDQHSDGALRASMHLQRVLPDAQVCRIFF